MTPIRGAATSAADSAATSAAHSAAASTAAAHHRAHPARPHGRQPALLAAALAATLFTLAPGAASAQSAGAAAPAAAPVSPAGAAALPTERVLPAALAMRIAEAAVERCRQDGFRVTVVVVDRAGQIRALLRGDGAGPHTPDSARRKAFTSASFRARTGELAARVAQGSGPASIKDIADVILLAGGVPIGAGGDVLGAVGVGGAPGGDRDEACADAGIAAVADRMK